MTVMTARKPDFGGYATRVNLVCSDGLTIMPGAFSHEDKKRVPLVWSHSHNNPDHILGHAILEDRADGTYTRAFFNDTPQGINARNLVKHGDITALSIFANRLKVQNKLVHSGNIKEVSLVMAGANPGAFIETVSMQHSDEDDMIHGEALVFTDEGFIFTHADDDAADLPPVDDEEEVDEEEDTELDEETLEEVVHSLNPKQRQVLDMLVASASGEETEDLEHAEEDSDDEDDDTETVQEVFDSLTPKQKSVVLAMVAQAKDASEAKHSDSEESTDTEEEDSSESDTSNTEDADSQLNHQEGTPMSRNLFEENGAAAKTELQYMSHADMETIANTAMKSNAKYSDVFLAHAAATYGIEDIDYMFPEAKLVGNNPELIARQADWVPGVLSGVKPSPFARIKSLTADLTADEARAKGYIKGNEKKDEVIKLLRRTTTPTTIYKKQKLDRDDIIDITDIDVVAWLKWEIRFMLNEEIARAILIGDGRDDLSEDKIKDPAGALQGAGIRSILHDAPLYAVPVEMDANTSPDDMIDAMTRGRTKYRGSGNPTFYTTDAVLTDFLLLKDKMGRRLYNTTAELASALRVKDIVSVAVMDEHPTLLGLVVNLVDYTLGANKGGELTFFEDFDIDFNQNKYLLETRLSGALTKPFSALVFKRKVGTKATPVAPSFNGGTNTITIPTVTGVEYSIDNEIVSGPVEILETTEVHAAPAANFYFANNITVEWTFSYTEV